ncbi:hypothetical protein AB0L65_55975 [Nonomuraea sp. NPDC052116]|uniref:hypothetical protein n=1 Tax=Nonomuraea sp. NPDC052116 TaxID=3155665 RepID=UPI00341D4BBF
MNHDENPVAAPEKGRGARRRQAHYRSLAADQARTWQARTAWRLTIAPREEQPGRMLPRAERCGIAILTVDHRPRGDA